VESNTNTKKARSRARIVREAAKVLRTRGIAGASVDEIMEAAELTRGGFYAHFSDKNALVAEALELAFQEARENLLTPKSPEQRSGRGWIEFASRRYVSQEHVQQPTERCPMPPLTGEIARADPLVRAVFTKNVQQNVATAERLIGPRGKRSRAFAIRMLCSWLGAMMVARAVDDEAFANEVLEATRADTLRDYDARTAKKARTRTGKKTPTPNE
jgi:TetR/AcrR family transcriptional repressor of nem operon